MVEFTIIGVVVPKKDVVEVDDSKCGVSVCDCVMTIGKVVKLALENVDITTGSVVLFIVEV